MGSEMCIRDSVKSANTQAMPISTPCSTKLFVNPPRELAVPSADRFPCGEVLSVELVCGTGCILIVVLLPPRYSGRCNLASGDVTPKCDCKISVYLVPPRASRSYNL